MNFNYTELSNRLELECGKAHKKFMTEIETSNEELSPGDITGLVEQLEEMLDKTTKMVLDKYGIIRQTEVEKRILTIADLIKKKCIDSLTSNISY